MPMRLTRHGRSLAGVLTRSSAVDSLRDVKKVAGEPGQGIQARDGHHVADTRR